MSGLTDGHLLVCSDCLHRVSDGIILASVSVLSRPEAALENSQSGISYDHRLRPKSIL